MRDYYGHFHTAPISQRKLERENNGMNLHIQKEKSRNNKMAPPNFNFTKGKQGKGKTYFAERPELVT